MESRVTPPGGDMPSVWDSMGEQLRGENRYVRGGEMAGCEQRFYNIL